jgi:hypothetical protein
MQTGQETDVTFLAFKIEGTRDVTNVKCVQDKTEANTQYVTVMDGYP